MADRRPGTGAATATFWRWTTDRDIVIRALARHLDPERTPVGEILSGDLVTVDTDDSIEQAVELMRERAVRRRPADPPPTPACSRDRSRPHGVSLAPIP